MQLRLVTINDGPVEKSRFLMLSLPPSCGIDPAIVRESWPPKGWKGFLNEEATHAFDVGAAVICESQSTKLAMTIWGREQCTLQTLDEGLEALRGASPTHKRVLRHAYANCVSGDQKATTHEAKLLRVISEPWWPRRWTKRLWVPKSICIAIQQVGCALIPPVTSSL